MALLNNLPSGEWQATQVGKHFSIGGTSYSHRYRL